MSSDGGATVSADGGTTVSSDGGATVNSDAGAAADTAAPQTSTDCGDGVCGIDESSAFCPKDCDSGASALSYCIAEKCVAEVQACLTDLSCQKILICIATGTKVATCLQNSEITGQNSSAIRSALLKCGNLACFGYQAPFSQCGDGVCSVGEKKACQKDCKPPKVPVCGDSFCQSATETRENCPLDCWDGPAFKSCFETKCPGPAADCKILLGCSESLACAAACSSNVCVDACRSQASYAWLYGGPLGICPFQKGCLKPSISSSGIKDVLCGDGICSPSESKTSCSEDC